MKPFQLFVALCQLYISCVCCCCLGSWNWASVWVAHVALPESGGWGAARLHHSSLSRHSQANHPETRTRGHQQIGTNQQALQGGQCTKLSTPKTGHVHPSTFCFISCTHLSRFSTKVLKNANKGHWSPSDDARRKDQTAGSPFASIIHVLYTPVLWWLWQQPSGSLGFPLSRAWCPLCRILGVIV